jgi:DNA-3-methyladenine glycosylase II
MIKAELDAVCLIDSGLKSVLDQVGYPEPRSRQPGFAALIEIINAQQLSTKAASAIWNRLETLCAGNVSPKKILNSDFKALRACGLSGRKVEYVTDLANLLLSGELCLESLDDLSDKEVIAELTRIRGLGRWTAEIYAMFAMGRQDMFPANDLALQVAVQRYGNLENRPDVKQTRKVAERWSPHRTAVAVLMWKFYGAGTLD